MNEAMNTNPLRQTGLTLMEMLIAMAISLDSSLNHLLGSSINTASPCCEAVSSQMIKLRSDTD